MEKLKAIQDRGPVNQTSAEVNKWHNQIVEAANWELKGIVPKAKMQASEVKKEALGGADNKMSGKVDEHEGMVKEIGNYNPATGKYESTWRKDVVEPAFEPGASLIREGIEDLLVGEKLPQELQPDVWNPRINGGRGGWEKAGYETPIEEED